MGRINYGEHLLDSKGIELGADSAKTGEWKTVSLPMTNLSALRYGDIPAELRDDAGFYKAIFTVDEPCDTFLRLDGFAKGFAVINGFNLGRYWTEAGPTKTLYVPATMLKKGENELVVFDSDGAKALDATFVEKPSL
jgi:beta-galactosidase